MYKNEIHIPNHLNGHWTGVIYEPRKFKGSNGKLPKKFINVQKF